MRSFRFFRKAATVGFFLRNFSFSGIALSIILMACAAACIDTVSGDPAHLDSIEFGSRPGYKDYCDPVRLPLDTPGWLFTIWTRIPKSLTAPESFAKLRGNMEVLYLDADNWHLICLVGNVDGYPDGYALYNANYMLSAAGGGGKGDYCTYQTLERDKVPLGTVNDWVWVAWQVIVNQNQTMSLLQWLKFGLNGTVFPAGQWDIMPAGEETVSIAGWNPGNPASFQLGADNTYSGENTGSNSYLVHARLQARSTKPSIAELDAIAMLNEPDPTAWGDWELDWKDGAPDLADRSGNGRHLKITAGGILSMGPEGPAFP